jgi:type IX secretion system PorP/SprF family membrane protein
MKTKNILLTAIVILSGSAMAQQIGLNSQYLFNEMIVNPGATGTKDYTQVQLNFRKQWVRFPDSPTSQNLSANAYIGKNFGLGGVINNDVAGPSRHTSLAINASYQLPLSANKNHKLGMGMSLSMGQHIIDETKLSTYLPDDPAVTRGFNNVMVPDASVGVFYYFKDKAFAGLSGKNLVQMNRDLYSFQNPLMNLNVRNYYLIGGYTFKLSEKFDLKSTALLQAIETGTWQGDITLLGVYAKRLWLGGSYRHNDAVVFMGGAKFGPFKFGYSYDYTLSDIGNYSTGSHEIFLELQLTSRERGNSDGTRTPWIKRNRLYSQGK